MLMFTRFNIHHVRLANWQSTAEGNENVFQELYINQSILEITFLI